MKRMLPIVINVIRENKSNDPDVIAKNLKIKVHYRALPKALKGLLIKTPFTKDVVINSRIDVDHIQLSGIFYNLNICCFLSVSSFIRSR